MSEKKEHLPIITSEWRSWFKPSATGCYVNDHTVIQSSNGNWHLVGITNHTTKINPEQERYFVHGWGESIESELKCEERTIDHGTRAWAPGVIQEKGKYYLYYGPSPTKMAVSPDLFHWINHEIQMVGSPIDASHRDHMILKINDYTWVMYVSGVRDGHGCISAYVSNDLIQWRFVQFALTTRSESMKPSWGAAESPFVVHYAGYYYLFITYTDCSDETYNDTLVFRSSNPYDFGEFHHGSDGETVIARLFGHASEVICDVASGRWYITTCGWPGKNIPHEGAVSVARLEWKEIHEDSSYLK
jgi:beta-xylosidase